MFNLEQMTGKELSPILTWEDPGNFVKGSSDNVYLSFFSHQRISQSAVRTSLEKPIHGAQLLLEGPVSVFLREPIAHGGYSDIFIHT